MSSERATDITSLMFMLSCMNCSLYGSVSLYHEEMSLVKLPERSLSAVNVGNFASSLFSSCDTLLRGMMLNTAAIMANTVSITAMYAALYIFLLSIFSVYFLSSMALYLRAVEAEQA